MSEEAPLKKMLRTDVRIEQIIERLDALEMAVSWLLSQLPEHAGHGFLCDLAAAMKNEGKSPGAVSEVNNLRAYLAAFRDHRGLWPEGETTP